MITRELSDLEKRVLELCYQKERETAWKSDWELQIEKDLENLEKIKKGDTDATATKLRRDWEDEWKVEQQSFKTEPRITQADQENDIKSWDRLLDRTLILVVQQKNFGNEWIFPCGSHVKGETLRQAAERILYESCGEDVKAEFYGNAPCGYHQLKYPKDIQEHKGVIGEKVFFYKAYVTGGVLKSTPVLNDYKWVAQNELNSVLSSDYFKSVNMFLLEEN